MTPVIEKRKQSPTHLETFVFAETGAMAHELKGAIKALFMGPDKEAPLRPLRRRRFLPRFPVSAPLNGAANNAEWGGRGGVGA